ncbi:MAG: hypothetical protein KBC56_02075 [Flavobacterium sp.]|nr:hypothetical protein [Flavobacterium sp.]
MKITFQTKEQSNSQQLDDFLKLSKAERFFSFVILSKKINSFPTKKRLLKNTNFIIDFTTKDDSKLG